MKKILILGASQYYTKNIQLLADAGFEVHAVDRNPEAYGVPWAHHFSAIDVSDKQAVLAYARQVKIDGVMTVNEFGIETAAFVSHAMGLPGLDPEAAYRFSDKGAMREAWQTAPLAQPCFRIISTLAELNCAAAEIGFPCVLKPTHCGGGGRGISVIRNAEEVEWAFQFAAPYAKGRFIVEAFMPGLELTVETFTLNGQVTVLGISDKVKPDLRTRVATSLNYWAAIPGSVSQSVEMLVTQALATLGLNNGMGHTEVIVTEEGPMLVEASPRGGGGHVFHTLIQAVSGVNAPVEFARYLTGLEVSLPPVIRKGGVYRFFNPPSGLLKAVYHLDEAKKLPGVLDIGMMKKSGERVGYLDNSLERAGYVVTTGPNRQEAIEVADAVERLVMFEVEAGQK